MLDGKIALVTGASRGIGYACAKALALHGAHVIAVARTVGGLEELDDEIQQSGGSATLVPLDLLDHEAIDRLGASIYERWGKLDIFVANAGVLGGLSPVDHVEPKTFHKIFNLNVHSNWRMIRSLAPLLRASENGRALFLTASEPDDGKPFWGAYNASYSALETLVKSWANETKNTALRINLFDPGPTRTALRAQAMPGEDRAHLAEPSEIAESLSLLCGDQLKETGNCFRFRNGTLQK